MEQSDSKCVQVSVIVTTYNSAKYISDCLESVLAQSFRDYEIVVVDDASTDETVEIVQRVLSNRSRYVVKVLEANSGGPARPRNCGVALAKGLWVALLDSDDLWHPQKLEIELQIAKDSESRFISCEKRWFVNRSETSEYSNVSLSNVEHRNRSVTHSQLLRKNFLCTSSVMAHRELFQVHPFWEARVYRAIEDYRCWLDIHRAAVSQHPQILTPLVFYRISSQSISGSKLRMARKAWLLYSDYFVGESLRWPKATLCMITYAFASIFRQLKYRFTRC
jgi:teichuronic acid biosynthesis glycosyltransferase TuaG